MPENSTKVQQGFCILLPMFSAYVAREMKLNYKDNWWKQTLYVLSDQINDLPVDGDWNELVGSLDIANCIRLLDRAWGDVFRRKLSIDYRTWAKELMGVRNRLAHIGAEDFSDDDTWRALDTMARLCSAFDDEAAEEIRALLREARYGSSSGSTAVTEAASQPQATKKLVGVMSTSTLGLPSWRDVIEPHPDVAQGRYKNAEFAADLAQVARGEGAYEYRDPVEFFARTYVTEGMKGLCHFLNSIKKFAIRNRVSEEIQRDTLQIVLVTLFEILINGFLRNLHSFAAVTCVKVIIPGFIDGWIAGFHCSTHKCPPI